MCSVKSGLTARKAHSNIFAGLVAGIWLQTGSDVKMLESGLEFLEKELSSSRESVEIYGSFFMPNKQ